MLKQKNSKTITKLLSKQKLEKNDEYLNTVNAIRIQINVTFLCDFEFCFREDFQMN